MIEKNNILAGVMVYKESNMIIKLCLVLICISVISILLQKIVRRLIEYNRETTICRLDTVLRKVEHKLQKKAAAGKLDTIDKIIYLGSAFTLTFSSIIAAMIIISGQMRNGKGNYGIIAWVFLMLVLVLSAVYIESKKEVERNKKRDITVRVKKGCTEEKIKMKVRTVNRHNWKTVESLDIMYELSNYQAKRLNIEDEVDWGMLVELQTAYLLAGHYEFVALFTNNREHKVIYSVKINGVRIDGRRVEKIDSVELDAIDAFNTANMGLYMEIAKTILPKLYKNIIINDQLCTYKES